ncbi:MAG: hypothetical protein C0177_05600, partial [Fervidicoccus fontis]
PGSNPGGGPFCLEVIIKMGKLRMTMPKNEQDIQKVVDEVMSTHPEMAHEHHHEEEGEELVEYMQAIAHALEHLEEHIVRIEEKLALLEKKINELNK